VILLVEDESDVRAWMRDALIEEGYEVLAASGGVQALRTCTLRAGPIDLVVTDVVMPGMSGPDLVRRLETQRPDLPVLYVSGYAGEDQPSRGLRGTGAELLEKPFNRRDLVRRIGRILTSRRQAQQLS
jgi:two-component system cell cycle sensor histidine kinase/response regulator CckA